MAGAPPPQRSRLWLVLTALVPLLLVTVHVRRDFTAAVSGDQAQTATGERRLPPDVCSFPGEGPDKPRVVLLIVDSLRDETAWDPAIMPWLSSARDQGLWGQMIPCLSQLSLLCLRTMLEGREPLFVTGLTNFSGMEVHAPNLVARLAKRGARVAVMSDHVAVEAYAEWIDRAVTFRDRTEPKPGRDAFAMDNGFAFLEDPTLDFLVILIIDTDAIAHREGIHTEAYRAKFREADDFLRDFAGRLRPQDTLLVLGDHGHDEHGHHSTGVWAPNAYLAIGPAFPPGVRVDVDMATTRLLLGVPTCEPVQPGYAGQLPFEVLRIPEAYLAALVTASAGLGRELSEGDADRAGVLLAWAPTLALAVVSLLLLLGLPEAERARRRAVCAVGGLLAVGLVAPPGPLLWAAAAAGLALLWPWRLPRGWLAGVRWGGLLLQVGSGAAACVLLVTLQDHVNPRWTLGFFAVVAALGVAAGLGLRRVSGLPTGRAVGLAAWGLIFYGLFLGPYYYGTARTLLFGITWLLLGTAWSRLKTDRALLRWVLVALLPLVPLHFPLMKEWHLRYPALEPVGWLGPVGVAGILAVVVGLLAALAPERRAFRRTGLLVAAYVAIGLATDIPPSNLAGCTLLIVSWAALSTCTRRLDDPWLHAIGQASYTLMFAFVSIRGLRIANFQFDFALDLVDPSLGESFTVVAIMPLLVLRYLVPFGLLLAAGERVTGRSIVLLLYKVVSLSVFAVGVLLVGARATALFERLLGQEVLMLAMALAFLVLFAGLGVGRRPGQPVP